MDYDFRIKWFMVSEIRLNIFNFVNTSMPMRILEIGSYEGMSSCFFSDMCLNTDGSRLTCVDPFDLSDCNTPMDITVEELFLSNIKNSTNYNKVKIYKEYSDTFFEKNTETYNFIYIDGSHVPEQIVRDMDNAYKCLETNGIMWMDDYRGNTNITSAIDEWIKNNRVEIIWTGYQIAIRTLAAAPSLQ